MPPGDAPPPRKPITFPGLIFMGFGLMFMAEAAGIIPLQRSRDPVPLWMIWAVGLMFFSAGVAIWFGPGNKTVRNLAGPVVATLMAVIFDWVAFGPGPRHFSGGTGLRIGPVVFSLWGLSPELEGRLVIGLGALMIDAMAVYGWVRFAREFAAGKLSTPAPRAAAAPSEAGIPTGVRIDRPAVPAVVGLLIVALAVGAVLTLKKGFQPPPAPLGVPIAAAPAPRSDGELVSPIQDGDIAFLQSEAGKLFWRGNEHENRKEHDAALADFTEALRLDPKRAMVYNSRAAVYGILRRDAEAVADYDEAVRLAPDDPANYQARGLLLANMGKRDLARADCEKLKTLDSAQGEWLCGYITRR